MSDNGQISRWLTELIFPWLRLRRIERELDAEERIAVANMKLELWRRQMDEVLLEFYRPTRFVTKFVGGAKCLIN